MPISPKWQGSAWSAGAILGFVASGIAVLALLGFAESAFELAHLPAMALWSVVWGGLAMAGVLISARLAFGYWPVVRPVALLAVAAGIGISATVHVVLQQWEIARFGDPEPDLVGFTAGLFALMIVLAVALFASLVSPAAARGWPATFTLLAALLTLVVIASNLSGVRDGVAAESWPLAVWLGVSAVYALAATIPAVRALLR